MVLGQQAWDPTVDSIQLTLGDMSPEAHDPQIGLFKK